MVIPRKTALHCGIAFFHGWIDCICLLRYRAFATMMVGNTMFLAVSLTCTYDTLKHDLVSSDKCPRQGVSMAFLYAAIILLYFLGSFGARMLQHRCGWKTPAFAYLTLAAGLTNYITSTSMLCGREGASTNHLLGIQRCHGADLFILAPTFGMITEITLKGELGAMPFATTGTIVSVAHHLENSISNSGGRDELRKACANVNIYVAFFLGVAIGTQIHKEGSILANLVCISLLLRAHKCIFRPEQPESFEQNAVIELAVDRADTFCGEKSGDYSDYKGRPSFESVVSRDTVSTGVQQLV